jgi:DNA-binding transcriptional LysR family regulator
VNLAGIDLNLLVALGALLRERSVSRAARAVGKTQPTMSHALGRLRDLLGDPLLVPVGRALVPTRRALALLPQVSEALARLEQLLRPPEAFQPASSRRTFRIAATDNLELYLLPRLVPLLLGEAPQVSLRFVHLQADWQERLQGGELDLKLGRHYPLPAALESRALLEERLVCLLRRGHPAARRKLGLAAFLKCDHLQVLPREGEAEVPQVDRALARRGLKRRVALTVSHFLAAPFAVAGSDLVLTCSERMAAALAAPLGLLVRPAPLPLSRYQLGMAWARGLAEEPASRWLRTLVERAAQG